MRNGDWRRWHQLWCHYPWHIFFSVLFFYIRIRLRFALIGGNLTAQKYFSTNVLPNISVWLGSVVKKSDIKSDVTSTMKENTTSHESEKDWTWLLPVLSFPLWHCEVGYTDIGQVSVPQFGAVKTGVHTILDSFSCQHEKLAVIVSTWPKNILPVSHISCKAEYLDTWIKFLLSFTLFLLLLLHEG